jgi:hypothetical protein
LWYKQTRFSQHRNTHPSTLYMLATWWPMATTYIVCSTPQFSASVCCC